MNKRPELKSFVKFGGAEYYNGVVVEFIHGRHAYLTIYHDDVEVEKVDLHVIPTEDGMHEMMINKGFTLKTDEEIAAIKAEKQKLRDIEEDGRKKREERRQQRTAEYLKKKLEKEGKTEPVEATAAKPISDVNDVIEDDEYGDGLTAEQRAMAERQRKMSIWLNKLAKDKEAEDAKTAKAPKEEPATAPKTEEEAGSGEGGSGESAATVEATVSATGEVMQ